jgi:hypothetical protein
MLRGDNEIGKAVLNSLKDRGVEIDGCANCWQQCNSSVERSASTWWYMSAKNKEKLRKTREIRRLEKKKLK